MGRKGRKKITYIIRKIYLCVFFKNRGIAYKFINIYAPLKNFLPFLPRGYHVIFIMDNRGGTLFFGVLPFLPRGLEAW